MNETENKINPFLNSTIDMNEKQEVDLSKLPEGLSTFEIDGFEISMFKNGEDIKVQIYGKGTMSIDEAKRKVQRKLEEQQ